MPFFHCSTRFSNHQIYLPVTGISMHFPFTPTGFFCISLLPSGSCNSTVSRSHNWRVPRNLAVRSSRLGSRCFVSVGRQKIREIFHSTRELPSLFGEKNLSKIPHPKCAIFGWNFLILKTTIYPTLCGPDHHRKRKNKKEKVGSGSTPHPGFQSQMKVYRDSLLKM